MRNRIILVLFMLPFISLMSASAHLSDLAKVKAKGQLVMLTLPGPTTYFEDGHGKNGFDYLLAKSFADSLGVELVVKTKSTLRRLLYSVGGPQGDFAAANLVVTAERNQSLVFGTAYMEVTQQLIYHRGSRRPQLIGKPRR